MFRRIHLSPIVMIVIGSLLGYAAASGKPNPALSANVAQASPRATIDPIAAARERPESCDDGAVKAELVALAAHNEKVAVEAQNSSKKPNILVIWGDDIGIHNISAYNHGIMGYKTPNIDRMAREGAMFTDFYAQQSCTAGRASFILGQHPFRTGLLTIGMPGSAPRHSRLDADDR